MKSFTERFTSAHAIALLALFVAIGGSAYAAAKIGTKQIKNNAVTAAKIKKNAVVTAKIKNNAVTAAKIKNNAVTEAKIKGNAVTAAKIGGGAVTAAKLADGSVTLAKVAEDAISTDSLKNGVVTPGKTSFFLDSGLIKLSKGETQTLLSEGPFTMTAVCEDGGFDSVKANLKIKNTSAEDTLIYSAYVDNFNAPVAIPGQEFDAFYPVDQSIPYWFGTAYNDFSATSADGNTSLYGGGNIGVNVLGADCVYQLLIWG
ncbi:MAG: hypothetical protein KDB54_05555 [Solirubrobacterales bacterium]|nr:hypothetical protein [Solirubrobacterales bacterium]